MLYVVYQGPDWEYSTELPYWAHDDFTEEDIRVDHPQIWKQPENHLLKYPEVPTE